jgi:hypothetical protein
MICAALMLWSSSVMARETLAVGACGADVKRICAGITPGEDRIRRCVREHIRELSGACLITLAKPLEVDQACRAHFNEKCASVQPGEGRLGSCLKSAAASLSNTCKNALSRAVPGVREKVKARQTLHQSFFGTFNANDTLG